MSDERPLFARLPDESVDAVYGMLRDRLEGGRDYTPPAAGSDPLAAVREHVRSMTPQQVEAAYKAAVRKLAPAPVPRPTDVLRSMGVGGMHPAAAVANRYMRTLGR